RRMLEDALDRLPRLAGVLRAEEGGGGATEPELVRAVGMAGADVPELLELEAALLGQTDLLGALPGLAAVGRLVDGGAVDEVGRAGVERAVARVAGGVHDLPPSQLGPFDRPGATRVVARQEEEPFPGADENVH